jgi:hypothetical protein
MSKPKLTPQIPGQPAKAEIIGQHASVAEANVQAAEALSAGTAEATAVPPADDGANEAQGDTPETTAPVDPTPAPEVIEAPQIPGQPNELPDAADIDPTKIKRAVQTKQGIVCPA